MTEHFEVLVVGAGPGGITAATVAAESGARVCLVDDNPATGGQIWRGNLGASVAASRRAREWKDRLRSSRCTVLAGMRVVSEPAERVLRMESDFGFRDLAFDRLVIATGARERFLPFPGWTLPGVMGAGAAQAFLKSGFNPAGRRTVVSGSGPLLLAVAALLRSKGARVKGVYEQASTAQLARFLPSLARNPGKIFEGLRYRIGTGFALYHTGCWVVKAEGHNSLVRVTICDGLKSWTVECDLLACGFHLAPNLDLPLLLGCRIEGGFVAVDQLRRTTLSDVFCVGELTGIGGLEKAIVEGQIAGWAAGGDLSKVAPLQLRLRKQMNFVRGLADAFELRPELRSLPQSETLVCRCEDVRFGALRSMECWRSAKLQTRIGMGPCQGRVCGAATEFLLGWKTGRPRPPLYSATARTLAAEAHECHSSE